jgi:Fic family protein
LYLVGVERDRFTSSRFGEVVKTPGPYGFLTFVPSRLPRSLPLTDEVVVRLSEADRALGRLAGAGRLLPNPHLLVNAYITREAVASSRIEGTQATLADVFEAATEDAQPSSDVREVVNYVAAMNAGIRRLDHLPISRRLLEEIHAVLLAGVRGAERNPGEVRRSPNWIGSPDNRPETAVFVPPPAEEMERGLSDWERFAHEEIAMPPLVRCGLLHYQFETLHPFLDGNGRLGRLLIIFYLLSEGHLPAPLLYVSSYFEEHKHEYYDRLQGVREKGDIEGWLVFFLSAVAEQANDAVSRAEALTDLRESFRASLRGSRSRAIEVVDMLLENPYATTASVAKRLGITYQGSTNLLRQLEGAGVLTPARRVSGRSNRWVAQQVLDVLTRPGRF